MNNKTLRKLSVLGLGLGLGLGLSLGFAPALHAENLSYAGKVVDEAGTGLPWALLSLDGGPASAQSDVNGNFTITGTAAVALYPEAHPNPSLSTAPSSGIAPEAFLPDGRTLSVTHGAAGSLYFRVGGIAAAPLAVPGPAGTQTSGGLAKSTASHTLGAAKVNYQTGSFPQAQISATGLVLTLAKSATDTATYAAEKKICLDTINACRATLGLKPVVWSKSLEAFADEGARYDAGIGTAHNHFGKFSVHAVPADAENALPGWPIKFYTVAAAMKEGTKQMWAEGPGGGHYENIKGDQASVGCGVFVTAAGNIWIVQDFK